MSELLKATRSKIEQQLLDGLNETDTLSACDALLIKTLALVTARIELDPGAIRPSMIAQQRALLRLYRPLTLSPSPDFFY